MATSNKTVIKNLIEWKIDTYHEGSSCRVFQNAHEKKDHVVGVCRKLAERG